MKGSREVCFNDAVPVVVSMADGQLAAGNSRVAYHHIQASMILHKKVNHIMNFTV